MPLALWSPSSTSTVDKVVNTRTLTAKAPGCSSSSARVRYSSAFRRPRSARSNRLRSDCDRARAWSRAARSTRSMDSLGNGPKATLELDSGGENCGDLGSAGNVKSELGKAARDIIEDESAVGIGAGFTGSVPEQHLDSQPFPGCSPAVNPDRSVRLRSDCHHGRQAFAGEGDRSDRLRRGASDVRGRQVHGD